MRPQIDPTLEGDAAWAPENLYVESIDVSEDGLTATVKFQKNYAGWLGTVANGFILPQHYFKDLPPEDGPNVMAVGAETLPQVP